VNLRNFQLILAVTAVVPAQLDHRHLMHSLAITRWRRVYLQRRDMQKPLYLFTPLLTPSAPKVLWRPETVKVRADYRVRHSGLSGRQAMTTGMIAHDLHKKQPVNRPDGGHAGPQRSPRLATGALRKQMGL
jgi:hypothetical protein